jgi:hypothetical protein
LLLLLLVLLLLLLLCLQLGDAKQVLDHTKIKQYDDFNEVRVTRHT